MRGRFTVVLVVHRWKMSAHALLKMTRDLFRAMSLALRQKCPRNVVEMKEAMAAFFWLWQRCNSVLPLWEIKNYFGHSFDVNVLSREYSVLKLAKNGIGMVWFSVIDVEIAGLHVEDMPKRWVIFALFVYCMFRATRYKKNYKLVEEKLLGFVLVYTLACTELHGSDSFVKCVSRFCVKIRLWLWI